MTTGFSEPDELVAGTSDSVRRVIRVEGVVRVSDAVNAEDDDDDSALSSDDAAERVEESELDARADTALSVL